MSKRLVDEPAIPLRRAVQIRVIYADTDLMGVVYHGTYLRYLERSIREAFEFGSTPIKLRVRKRTS